MPTIKLVVIGASGVGKTSLRNQYISGRFSTGYRATIGADFITKVLAHPTKPEETVTLQIWDTAGQERFSSLSSAFFRGADAALLMFDVNDEKTLEALDKWWAEFRDKVPLADEDMEEYCCVVVGNKLDLSSGFSARSTPISRNKAEEFLNRIVPTSNPLPPSPITNDSPHIPEQHNDTDADADDEDEGSSSNEDGLDISHTALRKLSPSALESRSSSIAIMPHRHRPSSSRHSPSHHSPTRHSPSRFSPSHFHALSKPRSRSSSRFYGGTMSTTHTTLTIYHTPSSSLFDNFESARSSPEPWSTTSNSSSSPSRPRRLTLLSNSSSSSGTVTPGRFARNHDHTTDEENDTELSLGLSAASTTATTPENDYAATAMAKAARVRASPPDRGAKLFFTSAKTGEGVRDVFEYIARRVIKKWEYDELMESRRMSMRDASTLLQESADTVRLGASGASRDWKPSTFGTCCGS